MARNSRQIDPFRVGGGVTGYAGNLGYDSGTLMSRPQQPKTKVLETEFKRLVTTRRQLADGAVQTLRAFCQVAKREPHEVAYELILQDVQLYGFLAAYFDPPEGWKGPINPVVPAETEAAVTSKEAAQTQGDDSGEEGTADDEKPAEKKPTPRKKRSSKAAANEEK